ncbi:MAG: hypothetical protein JWP45_200 [Mucilaginibacter sp.]|nr:hypothetical protein [Mucilaginibacter sp.]
MEMACTIIILPIVNDAPGQCNILNTNPSIIPTKLNKKSTMGYRKLKNIALGLILFLFAVYF